MNEFLFCVREHEMGNGPVVVELTFVEKEQRQDKRFCGMEVETLKAIREKNI
jgi:hypothetical protein